ncbi:1,4-dihydroxy-2-naphthoate octaprenyltransferase [Rubritalea tangerina]|uniref:1,4-dihydroxy-2-naphthoate octaprenyltransferase n=2 Tax=Rubritalea tangerina TaxID=430798 RepID=A0ABW4Z8V7_9BACT
MNETLKSCILAARPKTLPAAIVPVWLGCVLAWKISGRFDLWLAICTLMGAIWIQIATNFFNDAIDNDKGADTEKRLGPVRATASGMLSRGQVYGAATLCLCIAAFFGWFLIEERGWVMLAIGIPSLYLCYGYTGGPIPLAYRGLGELFVILFFGVIAVMGTIFVQLGSWPMEGILLGLQLGLLSSVLISINNLRDREEDAGNAKRTLAVKLGERWGKRVVAVEIFGAFALSIAWVYFQLPELWLATAFFIPLGVKIWIGVRDEPASQRYNQFLAMGGAQLILFAILFTVACVL